MKIKKSKFSKNLFHLPNRITLLRRPQIVSLLMLPNSHTPTGQILRWYRKNGTSKPMLPTQLLKSKGIEILDWLNSQGSSKMIQRMQMAKVSKGIFKS